jgi:hypothetical protein
MPEDIIQIRLPADTALRGVVQLAARYAAGLCGLRQVDASRLAATLAGGFRRCAADVKAERSSACVAIVLETEMSALRVTLSHGRRAPVLEIVTPSAASRLSRGSPRGPRRRV